MRTVTILIIGLLLWLCSLAVARLLAGNNNEAMYQATLSFIAIWFIVAAGNMWIGVMQAGYPFLEELPIFLLIFLLPAGIALLVRWKLL